ncbi:MAG: hypothetical protein ABIH82_02470 [Candidatus Woesearchaeota archaeon]
MLNQISQKLKDKINSFSIDDKIIFNNKYFKIDKANFTEVLSNSMVDDKTISFIDGGQAEIISAGNFCLSLIRVVELKFNNNKKFNQQKHEFFLLTTAESSAGDLWYESKIYGDKLIDEMDLLISSNDSSIKIGNERAAINKVVNIARRFAELSLAFQSTADFIVLDGTLEKTFKNEEKYLGKLFNGTSSGSLNNTYHKKICSLAKSSTLFTALGNSPVVLLNQIGPNGCWNYNVDHKTSFVKLHPRSKHVFRFEGNKEVLPFLVQNSHDATFLGYPYGLILVDKIARVTNEEKSSLSMQFLLNQQNKEIVDYLKTTNAHQILDNMG